MRSDDKLRHIIILTKTLVFKCRELISKHRELVKYMIFGILTTAVEYGVYFLANEIFCINETASNATSWFIAVLFAFVTNKICVFKSKSSSPIGLLYEFSTFFAARGVTGFIYIAGFPLLTEFMGINGYLTKALLSVFNIVVNYVFSKLVIFNKKNKKDSCNDNPDKQLSRTIPHVSNGAIVIGDSVKETLSETGEDTNEA